jgi:hypothetical protein
MALGILWFWGEARLPELHMWAHRLLHGMPGLGTHQADVIEQAFNDSTWILQRSLAPLVFSVMLAVPLTLLIRMVARARARAGLTDPLDRVRSWTLAHPKATERMLAAPALLLLVTSMRHIVLDVLGGKLSNIFLIYRLDLTFGALMALFASLMIAVSRGVHLATRAGLRALTAPTLDRSEAGDVTASTDRRVAFDAVAVTTETRVAVAAMAALPFATFFAVSAAHLGDTATQVVLGAYVSVALVGMLAFRRASRIAVGVDGIFVTGTSRQRFFAYKDLDGVRVNGSDLELVRGDHVLLRLQLHGEDATQKESIAKRVEEAIAAARAGDGAAAGQVVASASEEELARLAEGAADYRSAAVTREQLWSLVEGPEHDASTRTAAARALLTGSQQGERTRLRVAAAQCAQPQVKVALMDLAGEDDDEEPVVPGRVARVVN